MSDVSPGSLFIAGGAQREMTVKEYAGHERVTTRTVWTWIQKGAVPIRRTPGGGVRVHVARADGVKSSEV